jgi:Tfp pilus assembly protein PilW
MTTTRRGDAGISLVELLVAMMLLGLIMAMVTGLFISVSKTVALGQAINDSSRVASNAANELSRVIRVGTTLSVSGTTIASPAFLSAGRESVTFYSNVDVNMATSVAVRSAQPTMVRFDLNSNRQLVESRWTATAAGRFWTFPATTTTPNSTRNLGGPLTAPTGAESPLFTYFDETTPVPVQIATPASGSMSGADLKRIASVRITIKVPSPNASGNPATFTNTIVLPNL